MRSREEPRWLPLRCVRGRGPEATAALSRATQSAGHDDEITYGEHGIVETTVRDDDERILPVAKQRRARSTKNTQPPVQFCCGTFANRRPDPRVACHSQAPDTRPFSNKRRKIVAHLSRLRALTNRLTWSRVSFSLYCS